MFGQELMVMMFPNGKPTPLEYRVDFATPADGPVHFGDLLRVSPEAPPLLRQTLTMIAPNAPPDRSALLGLIEDAMHKPLPPAQEVVHAVVLQVGSRIDDNAEQDELREWERVLRSAPGGFVPLRGDDDAAYFYSANLRSKARTSAKALAPRTSQTILDIVCYKQRKEAALGPMSAKLIAELYKQHYLGDGGPECRTKVSTVEKALEVYDRLFKHEPSRDLLIEAERTLPETGNPFQGIWKLHELAKLTRGNGPKAEWVLQVALNRIRTGSLDPGEFSVRNFSGRGGGRQYVDIILKQRDVKLFLLGPWLDSRSLAPVYKEKLREIFSDPKAYITKLRPLVEFDEVDTTWRALWPKSASMALELIEMAAYSMGSMEDAVFRGAVKNSKSAEEIVVELAPFRELAEQVDSALAEEAKPLQPALVAPLATTTTGDQSQAQMATAARSAVRAGGGGVTAAVRDSGRDG